MMLDTDRFLPENETVTDRRTGLMWTRNASLFDYPLAWQEALDAVRALNHTGLYGYHDWKIPNRKELLSLISHSTINPSLPAGHPFTHVFSGYHWTSSTCARLPDQAWYIHLGGARVFKGMKYGSYMLWPVRAVETRPEVNLLQTGQKKCFDESGNRIDCRDTGQDGQFQSGRKFTGDRFTRNEQTVRDQHTGLTWLRDANARGDMMDWEAALGAVSTMNRDSAHGRTDWRLPNILELESLTDLDRHSPALPEDHPFINVQDFYWSSTTSMYDMTYAWALYLVDGAVGVGHKPLAEFYLWPVSGKVNV